MARRATKALACRRGGLSSISELEPAAAAVNKRRNRLKVEKGDWRATLSKGWKRMERRSPNVGREPRAWKEE
jgi:hypothetical protein